ncbi:HD domain-containing protein [Massilia alkalitolerans]|uniref:HD domain-containing protein n=1 Tax=Massilia alkalitolerans TaxID=286638 RepID=UPI0028AE9D36|nr:ATP-binding protein [Massilia alkalitolerans]
MTDLNLLSYAEQQAAKAESLECFHGLNLLYIKRQIAHLLSMIGRDGIFDSYTIHDISHIDKMLKTLDWIIPEKTKDLMSSADWLMTVLGIYFHDLGMLVTTNEYDHRDHSDFPRFKADTLYAGQAGSDYKEKVQKLAPDRVERFLYQEFVRSKHAERVKLWVTGGTSVAFGVASEVMSEVDKLLMPLGQQFRRDLGLICESHHLNDLDNRKKYKVAEPYGDSDAATANVQYCAILLRTADLLHITADRTPSIMFKVINPTDPVSQEEWAKQQAVKRVQAKFGVNEEGQLDEKAPRDTIQVSAYFESQDGFFGLTSYLYYCAEQLKMSNQWVSNANKEELSRHEFPWRRIDDSNIQTKGFLRDTFEFAIDQAKILDLLTGHTLYNDTRVVLRELVQNALDAIRIENYPHTAKGKGRVDIVWNSETRVLSVKDNGTGMTQKIVSDFLLKVGTSRYQDPEFKKQYPNFSSISRFGIGVLSAFMIADSVAVTTCHPEDAEARQLTLRSVHGKYLIRLLDKSDADVKRIGTHGTCFELTVRPSVKMDGILDVARMWIVAPGCDVYVTVDDNAPIKVGYDSLGKAVIGVLAETGIRAELALDAASPPDDSARTTTRVIEKEINGVSVAFAVQWSPYFRQWAFVDAERLSHRQVKPSFLGTCIEGIRVEFDSPGYIGRSIIAMANVTGSNAPRTNVARSGLEATQERDEMLRHLYSIYTAHVAEEVEQLRTSRSYSLTRAIDEAKYLVGGLMQQPISSALLDEALASLEVLAVETASERQAMSPNQLATKRNFWTIESTLLHPAEVLLREAPTSTSLFQVVRALNLPEFSLPQDAVLCGVRPSSVFGAFAYLNREVDKIIVDRAQRRIDLRWTTVGERPRWISLPHTVNRTLRELSEAYGRSDFKPSSILIGIGDVEQEGDIGPALITSDKIFIMPATSLSEYLQPIVEGAIKTENVEKQLAAAFTLEIIQQCLRYTGKFPNAEKTITNVFNRWESHLGPGKHIGSQLDLSSLIQFVNNTTWSAFAPSRWSRNISESGRHFAYGH